MEGQEGGQERLGDRTGEEGGREKKEVEREGH